MKTVVDAAEIARWQKIAQQDYDYHRRQFLKEYRSTSFLGDFIKSLIGSTPGQGQALDVGCGAGANIFHLAQKIPGLRWSGVDIAGDTLFPIGNPFFESQGLDVALEREDFFRLEDHFGEKKFDLVLAIQTLSSVASYDALLDQLLAVTKGWLFVNAMFTEFDVDVKIEVTDYTWPEDCPNPGNYNVYSLPRFRRLCEAKGCQQFVSRDFVIDVDLPVPENGGLGTYTRKLEDGQRVQFSGPIFLPWKVVGVRMGDWSAISVQSESPNSKVDARVVAA